MIFPSNRKNKKYMILLDNGKPVHFGDSRYQHYKDQTSIRKFSHLDHLDEDRRKAFKSRFRKAILVKNSPAYFSNKYLW